RRHTRFSRDWSSDVCSSDLKTHLSRASRIESQLRERFAPVHFVLTDQSASHAGHAGARPGGETHYHLAMHASAFEGLSRVARQQIGRASCRERVEIAVVGVS